MAILLDNDISYRIAHALKALGQDVDAMRDVYGEDAKDPDWIPAAAKAGYVVITVDRRMQRVQSECKALKDSKLTVLFIRPFFSKLKMWPKAVWMISKWDRIAGYAVSAKKGTTAEVQLNGSCSEIRLK